MKEKLDPSEQARLNACNKIIADGLKTCFDVGAALLEIKDSKLYREQWDSFEDFCQINYQIGRHRALQLIDAFEVKKSVDSKSQTVGNQQKNVDHGQQIINERQTRALGKVPENKRVEVLEKAASTGSPITAKAIVIATKQLSQEKETIQLDKEEFPIPPKTLDLWNHAEEVAHEALQLVIKLRSIIKAAEESCDVVFAEFRSNENKIMLDHLFGNFKLVVPHGICTTCQGLQPSKCLLCKGRGFLSHHAYKMFANDQVKTIRSKARKS